MFEPGSRVRMTKGYKGVQGVITETTESEFEFYVVKLDSGITIVVGPSAFEPAEANLEKPLDNRQ